MSAKPRHRFNISVRLVSPFIFPGAVSTAGGVDTPAMRDEAGRPILPADHLKGLLREAMRALTARALVTDKQIGDWFGWPTGNDDNKNAASLSWDPLPGRLHFGDLAADAFRVARDSVPRALNTDWVDKFPISRRTMTRIKINEERGAVEEGMLQVVELAAPLRALVDFKGELLFYADAVEKDEIGAALRRALALVPYFGGQRSAGFGRHLAADSSMAFNASDIIAPLARAEACTVEINLDRPLLVDAERIGANIYLGRTIVPGGAIKGALADMLRARDPTGTWGGVLSRMRVSHAFPTDALGARLDLAAPMSLMSAKPDGKPLFADSGSRAEADKGLIDGVCADFPPDWKPEIETACRKLFKWPASDIARLARIRTEITPESGTAEDEKLFVEVARGGKDLRLRFDFAFDSADIDTDEARLIGSILTTRLDAIGKTRAAARLCKLDPPKATPPIALARCWRIVLETATALLDLDSPLAPRAAPTGTQSAFDQLKVYFAAALPGAMLDDCYLKLRRLAGYRTRRGSGGVYQPITLFEPGCVFVVAPDAGGDAATLRAALETLRANGLPAMRWDGPGTLRKIVAWTESVLLPESGYGAIRVEPMPEVAR